MSKKELSLRDQILEISRHYVYTEGHASLSMRKIANEVGVTATSIYLHFKNKDDLIHTLIEESVDEMSQAIIESADQYNSTIDKFEAIIKTYAEFALSNAEKYQIIFAVQPNSIAKYPKEKFRKIRKVYRLLESVILKGINEGIMELDEPLIAAYSIWAQLHGVIAVILNQRLDSRIDREKFLEESLELIVQGFLIRTTTT